MARGRQQRAHERLIPREVFEADEARRRARRARGDDSDDSTVTTVDLTTTATWPSARPFSLDAADNGSGQGTVTIIPDRVDDDDARLGRQ